MKHISVRVFRFCVVFFMLLGVYSSRAQYVTIPDPNFANWLVLNGYGNCVSGNQLDTTCIDILNATSVSCNSASIQYLDDIQYFKNLTYLECSSNQITSLPPLPPLLATLNCSNNRIYSLPVLPVSLTYLACINNRISSFSGWPDSLQTLYCYNNNLYSISPLPATLQLLSCNDNPLYSLPSLPPALTQLSCRKNYLDSLPLLPPGLWELQCDSNNITSLPALPATLIDLQCTYNPHLSNLPSLPDGLQDLDCYNDSLTAIPSPMPSSLSFFYCDNNYITSLPPLAGTHLSWFTCNNNLLTSIPALPNTLQTFGCSYNQLTSLPLLPPALRSLGCNNNMLTSLPPLPHHLSGINCWSNLLTSLPPMPDSVVNFSLECYNNNLTSIPDMPDSVLYFLCNNNPNLTCLPRFKSVYYLRFDSTAITCLPTYGTVRTYRPAGVPLCGIINTHSCPVYWNLSGMIYYDVNNNCVFDSTAIAEDYVKVKLYRNGVLQQQVYSGGSGLYSLYCDSIYGTYTSQVDTTGLPFTVSCPDSGYYTSVVSAGSPLYYNQNFSLKCRTVGFDLGVKSVMNDYVVPRPGTAVGVNMVAGDMAALYRAHCASGISGKIQLIYTGAVTFNGVKAGALPPTAISGDTITWDVADFGAINIFTAFNTIFTISADHNAAGTQACFTVQVISPQGDFDLSNNTLSNCFTIVNALDPNEKEVYPTTYIDSTIKWMTYTIRFQNVGTAPAQNIIVIDTLSPYLDASTFELMAYSAANVTQILPGGIVKFNFPDINLPDSLMSDSASHGFVQYRIKPKRSVPAGSIINNTASIYFDLNPAVVTNTVVNSVATSLCSATYDTITDTTCTGSPYNFNGRNVSATGTYYDTLTNAGGCDSIITLHLTVTHRDTITQLAGLCAGDSVYFYGTYIHSPGTYDTLLLGGCDTLAIINLVVQDPLPPVYLFQNICSGDSLLFNGVYIDTTGTYTAHYNSLTACDSSVILRLTVDSLPALSLTRSCYSDAGTYECWWAAIFALQYANCDSVKWFFDDTLIARPQGDTISLQDPNYTVVHNLPGTLIPVQLFLQNIICITGYNNCGQTTICDTIRLIGEGINEILGNNAVNIYPNPATDQLFIKTANIQPQSITIYDVNGRIICSLPFKPEVNINELSSGVYFVEVQSNEGVARKRFVKM